MNTNLRLTLFYCYFIKTFTKSALISIVFRLFKGEGANLKPVSNLFFYKLRRYTTRNDIDFYYHSLLLTF